MEIADVRVFNDRVTIVKMERIPKMVGIREGDGAPQGAKRKSGFFVERLHSNQSYQKNDFATTIRNLMESLAFLNRLTSPR